jgi:hypothetical protein
VPQLGSTIVLVFEAPPEFVFTLDPHTKVRLGQAIGVLASVPDEDEAVGDDAADDDDDDDDGDEIVHDIGLASSRRPVHQWRGVSSTRMQQRRDDPRRRARTPSPPSRLPGRHSSVDGGGVAEFSRFRDRAVTDNSLSYSPIMGSRSPVDLPEDVPSF